jgi:CBS domain-containing protein
VYDYHPGKLDWIAHRGPVEGELARIPKVGDFARDDVVTCRLEDQVGAVGARIEDSAFPFGLVTSPSRVILGRLRSSMLDCDPALRAEEVMEPGPKTLRPHKSAAGAARELAERDLRWAIVTTPEGELIGVATRTELEAASG